MDEVGLLALRARFSVQQGSAVARGEEYAALLTKDAGEVPSPDGRRGSVPHLLALIDAALSKKGGAPNFSNMTKDELYKLAKEHDVDGRSEMDKPGLIKAVKRAWQKAFNRSTK